MGCIWSARHETLGTLLAVKFINPINTSSSELRGRFEREAVASARISSAHVVQAHDYGVEDDTPYLVMELLEGEDLAVRLKREKRLSLEATCSIVIQVAKGLRRAHEAGIIHRDLKPANIFIARDMDEEVVKILDFGIAKLTWSPEATGMGQLVGSPLYMSPEQIQQLKSIDHRSDLWSLAVILFRAITGANPFPGDTTPDVLINILGNSSPVPSQIDPSFTPEIDAFFKRAFKREPCERFQSAREMADAFVEAALGEPLSASSWSIVGLHLSQRTSSSPLLTPYVDATAAADRVTVPAPEPAPAPAPPATPAHLKTLPSAMSLNDLVDRSVASRRTPKEMTTQLDMVTPPLRRAGGFKLWQALGVSAILGFGLGWHVLPGSTPTSTRLEQGVSAATMTGSSMLRSMLGARDNVVASAGQAWPRDAGAAPVSPTRPLEKADSVLANEYALTSDNMTPTQNTAASKPAGRPTTRRQR
jgi:serine/threonine-protein kinase